MKTYLTCEDAAKRWPRLLALVCGVAIATKSEASSFLRDAHNMGTNMVVGPEAFTHSGMVAGKWIKHAFQCRRSHRRLVLKSYARYADPGHSWLEVPITDLRDVGVAGKITPYSYISSDGRTVYLEEDLDLWTFMDAFKAKHGYVPQQIDHHTNNQSPVRSYRHYSRHAA